MHDDPMHDPHEPASAPPIAALSAGVDIAPAPPIDGGEAHGGAPTEGRLDAAAPPHASDDDGDEADVADPSVAAPALSADAAAGGTPDAPPADVPAPYVPRPKLPIVPERAPGGYRTAGVTIERAPDGRGVYIACAPGGKPARVYVSRTLLDKLVDLAVTPALDTGKLWRTFAALPLERLLPNRQLEEELRALLTQFASELRK